MSVILVIDDNPELRTDILDILRLEKYVVLEAENGSIGFDMIVENQPDLIVCDIDMPIMTGLELLKILKANEKYRKIPFIIFSGNSDEKTPTLLAELGVDKYIIKPSSMSRLLNVISHLLKSDIE